MANTTVIDGGDDANLSLILGISVPFGVCFIFALIVCCMRHPMNARRRVADGIIPSGPSLPRSERAVMPVRDATGALPSSPPLRVSVPPVSPASALVAAAFTRSGRGSGSGFPVRPDEASESPEAFMARHIKNRAAQIRYGGSPSASPLPDA